MLTRNNWRFFQSWLEVARQHNTLPQCLRRRSSRAQSLSSFPQTEIVPQIRKISTAVFSSSCVLQSTRLKPGRLRCDTVLTSRLKTLPCRHDGQIYSTVGFRTSAPRQAIPPLLVLLFVKPIAKLTAILSGRTFRNWWRALPHNKRQYFYESLRRHKYKILAALLGLTGVCSVYYYSHLQTTPFTNRKRFIAFTDSQFKKIAASEYEKMKSLHAEKSVHSSHPLYLTIAKLVIKITEANSDIPEIRDRTWTIHIIDKDVKNAFVLPNGEIFVFAGILKAVTNEDQLGAVLAHEIAHVVLNHALLLEMPYSRSLETEADRVGLILAAKSCFDVRECKAFWELMALRSDAGEEDTVDIEWLSTHPTHQNRADSLGAHMPEVLKLREECKCPPLPAVDPSAVVAKQRQILLEEQERRRKEPPSISGIRITS